MLLESEGRASMVCHWIDEKGKSQGTFIALQSEQPSDALLLTEVARVNVCACVCKQTCVCVHTCNMFWEGRPYITGIVCYHCFYSFVKLP